MKTSTTTKSKVKVGTTIAVATLMLLSAGAAAFAAGAIPQDVWERLRSRRYEQFQQEKAAKTEQAYELERRRRLYSAQKQKGGGGSAGYEETSGYKGGGPGVPGYETPGYKGGGPGSAGYETSGYEGGQIILTPLNKLNTGDIIKSNLMTTLYYYKDGGRYTFATGDVYFSWYTDLNNVKSISHDDLKTIPLVQNVTMRPGSWLIKITSDPNIYAVTPGGVLRKITSESAVSALWGSNWSSKVKDVADAFFTNYKIGPSLDIALYPDGSLVKDGASTYYIQNGIKRWVSPQVYASNRFQDKFVVNGDLSDYPTGSNLGAYEVASPVD